MHCQTLLLFLDHPLSPLFHASVRVFELNHGTGIVLTSYPKHPCWAHL